MSILYRYTGTRIPDPLFPHLVPPAIMVWIFVWKYIFEPFIHILQRFVLLVLLTFVSRSSCRIIYIIYIHRVRKVPKIKIFIFGTFLTLSLKLMQWYVTSVSRGSLYETFGNKCVKILKFWRTEL